MLKTKVLIVDDEADYLELIQERVEYWGYAVEKAQNGKEALTKIKEKSVDIVILDYFMPDMDGITVLKQIRKFDKNLAVIMLTAHADVKNIKSTQELGVSSFIPKLSVNVNTAASLKVTLGLIDKQIRKRKVSG